MVYGCLWYAHNELVTGLRKTNEHGSGPHVWGFPVWVVPRG